MATETTVNGVTYVEETIGSNIPYVQPLTKDTLVPVIKLNNCEVLFSSLNTPHSQFGESIDIILCDDCEDFVKLNKAIKDKLLERRQVDDPDLDTIKSALKRISNKDVLQKPRLEKYLNKFHINFKVSRAQMFDRKTKADGEVEEKAIQNKSQATGQAIMKYFAETNPFTNTVIKPDVFKFTNNGEKIRTWVSPKTQKENPFYLNAQDLVNITFKPYWKENQKTGECRIYYELLTVEIVATAWERGIGKTGNDGSRKPQPVAPTVTNDDELMAIFGGMSSTVTSTPATTTAPAQTQNVTPAPTPVTAPQVDMTVVNTAVPNDVPPAVQPAPTVTTSTTTADVDTLVQSIDDIDFSVLLQ